MSSMSGMPWRLAGTLAGIGLSPIRSQHGMFVRMQSQETLTPLHRHTGLPLHQMQCGKLQHVPAQPSRTNILCIAGAPSTRLWQARACRLTSRLPSWQCFIPSNHLAIMQACGSLPKPHHSPGTACEYLTTPWGSTRRHVSRRARLPGVSTCPGRRSGAGAMVTDMSFSRSPYSAFRARACWASSCLACSSSGAVGTCSSHT